MSDRKILCDFVKNKVLQTFKKDEKKCNICFEKYKNDKYDIIICGHLFCKECLKKHEETKLKDDDEVKCPICNTIYISKESNYPDDPDDKIIENYEKLRFRRRYHFENTLKVEAIEDIIKFNYAEQIMFLMDELLFEMVEKPKLIECFEEYPLHMLKLNKRYRQLILNIKKDLKNNVIDDLEFYDEGFEYFDIFRPEVSFIENMKLEFERYEHKHAETEKFFDKEFYKYGSLKEKRFLRNYFLYTIIGEIEKLIIKFVKEIREHYECYKKFEKRSLKKALKKIKHVGNECAICDEFLKNI